MASDDLSERVKKLKIMIKTKNHLLLISEK